MDRRSRLVEWVLASVSVGIHAGLTRCVHSTPAGRKFTQIHWEAER